MSDLPFTAIRYFLFYSSIFVCKPIGVDFAYRTVVFMCRKFLTDKFSVWECSANSELESNNEYP